MNLNIAIPVFLVLAMLCCNSEANISQASEEEADNAFSYSCLISELFTLYNQSSDYAIAECSPAVVCNQALKPAAEMTLGSKPMGPSSSNAIDKPKVRATAARRRRKSQSEHADETMVMPADVWLLQPNDHSAPYSYLKKIEKTTSGYSATFCTIQCSSSTSTVSTRPTTQKHTQPPTTAPVRQEKKETGHKKGLFNGHGCFSGEMIVETPTGEKRMDQLHVDDRVLVFSSDSETGSAAFEPIEWFYHHNPNRTIDYISLETQSGYRISITANHLITFVPCTAGVITPFEMDRSVLDRTRFARRAKLDDCLAVKTGDRFVADRITKISTERKRGVYSPITDRGTLVVNGVQVSCYSSVENQALQRSVHSILIKAKRMIQKIRDRFNADTRRMNRMEEKDIPNVLMFLLNFAKKILPPLVQN